MSSIVNKKILKTIIKKYPELTPRKWELITNHDQYYDHIIGYVYNDSESNSQTRKVVQVDTDEFEDCDDDSDECEKKSPVKKFESMCIYDTISNSYVHDDQTNTPPVKNNLESYINEIKILKTTDMLESIDKYYNNDPNIMIYMGEREDYQQYVPAYIEEMFRCDDKKLIIPIIDSDSYIEQDGEKINFENANIFFNKNKDIIGTLVCSICGYDYYIIKYECYEEAPIHVISKNKVIVTAIESWNSWHDGDSGMSSYKYDDSKLLCYGGGDDTNFMLIDFKYQNSEKISYTKKKLI